MPGIESGTLDIQGVSFAPELRCPMPYPCPNPNGMNKLD